MDVKLSELRKATKLFYNLISSKIESPIKKPRLLKV